MAVRRTSGLGEGKVLRSGPPSQGRARGTQDLRCHYCAGFAYVPNFANVSRTFKIRELGGKGWEIGGRAGKEEMGRCAAAHVRGSGLRNSKVQECAWLFEVRSPDGVRSCPGAASLGGRVVCWALAMEVRSGGLRCAWEVYEAARWRGLRDQRRDLLSVSRV
ncbi:hypothetical protein BD626DRAFT_478665, partial [Schizophyllum amplum]